MNRIYLLGSAAALVCTLSYTFLTRKAPDKYQVGKINSQQRQLALNEVRYRSPESEDPTAKANWELRSSSGDWLDDPQFKKYFREKMLDREFDWKQRIDFWGIVLDEKNTPVSRAVVRFTWSDLSPDGTSSVEVESSDGGEFSLEGRSGKGLSVSVRKEGYRGCGKSQFAFEYADPSHRAYHRPDPNRPVAFNLIQRGIPEPILRRERMEFRVVDASGILRLDLLRQNAVGMPINEATADIEVRVFREPILSGENGEKFNWKVALTVPDGGLQTGDECPAYAPEDGYVSRILFQRDTTSQISVPEVDDWFFLKSRGGRCYSRVRLKVSATPSGGGAPTVYIHEYVLNPSGSRNLEFYPEMQVAEKYYVPRDP